MNKVMDEIWAGVLGTPVSSSEWAEDMPESEKVAFDAISGEKYAKDWLGETDKEDIRRKKAETDILLNKKDGIPTMILGDANEREKANNEVVESTILWSDRFDDALQEVADEKRNVARKQAVSQGLSVVGNKEFDNYLANDKEFSPNNLANIDYARNVANMEASDASPEDIMSGLRNYDKAVKGHLSTSDKQMSGTIVPASMIKLDEAEERVKRNGGRYDIDDTLNYFKRKDEEGVEYYEFNGKRLYSYPAARDIVKDFVEEHNYWIDMKSPEFRELWSKKTFGVPFDTYVRREVDKDLAPNLIQLKKDVDAYLKDKDIRFFDDHYVATTDDALAKRVKDLERGTESLLKPTFWNGIKEGFLPMAYTASGLSGAEGALDIKTDKALDKALNGEELTAEEQLLVDLFAYEQKLNEMRGKFRPNFDANKFGSGALQSAGYMMNLALEGIVLGGGLVGGIKTTVKEAFEEGLKTSVKEGMRNGMKLASKQALVGLGDDAVRNLANPMMVSAYGERRKGQYTLSDGVLMKDETNPYADVLRAYMDSFAERAGERVGTLVDDGLDVFGRAVAQTKAFGRVAKPLERFKDMAPVVIARQGLRQARIQGFVGEVASEYATAFMQPILNGDLFKSWNNDGRSAAFDEHYSEVLSKDTALSTIAICGAMSGVGTVVNMGAGAYAGIKINSLNNSIKKNLEGIRNDELRNQVYEAVNSNDYSKVAAINWGGIDDVGDVRKATEAIFDFAKVGAIKGELSEAERIEAFMPTLQTIIRNLYRGADRSNPIPTDGEGVKVVQLFDKNNQFLGNVIFGDVDSKDAVLTIRKPNGATATHSVSELAIEGIKVRPVSMANAIAEQYALMFGKSIAKDRLKEAMDNVRGFKNMSEEAKKQVLKDNGFSVYKVGDVVTLADGRSAVIASDAVDGYYNVETAGANGKPVKVMVGFESILSNNPDIAQAQMEAMAEGTLEAPVALPVDAEGNVKLNEINDGKTLAMLSVAEFGSKEYAVGAIDAEIARLESEEAQGGKTKQTGLDALAEAKKNADKNANRLKVLEDARIRLTGEARKKEKTAEDVASERNAKQAKMDAMSTYEFSRDYRSRAGEDAASAQTLMRFATNAGNSAETARVGAENLAEQIAEKEGELSNAFSTATSEADMERITEETKPLQQEIEQLKAEREKYLASEKVLNHRKAQYEQTLKDMGAKKTIGEDAEFKALVEKTSEVLGLPIIVTDKPFANSRQNGIHRVSKDGNAIYINSLSTHTEQSVGILAHEIVHEFKQFLKPEEWAKFEDVIMTARFGKDWANSEAYKKEIEDIQDAERRSGHAQGVGNEKAREEVVAYAIQDYIFNGADGVRAFEAIVNQDLNWRDKLIEALRKVVDKLKSLFNGESKAVQEAIAEFENVFKRYAQKSGEIKAEQIEGETAAIINEKDGQSSFSLSTYEDGGRDILQNFLTSQVEGGKLEQKDANAILTEMDAIYDICMDYKDEYAPFGAWSDAAVVRDDEGMPVFSVIKANGDYAMNLDFSLVCKKRRTLDAVLNEMIGRKLIEIAPDDPTFIAKVNDIVRKYGFETACRLCFVDAKRFRVVSTARNFCKLYNGVVAKLMPTDKKVAINSFDAAGVGYPTHEGSLDTLADSELNIKALEDILKRNGEKTVIAKIARHLLDHPEDRKLVHISDFVSTRGFDPTKALNPQILSLYNSKKGSGGPKASFSDVQYLNDVIYADWNKEDAYAVGGVRVQSFSDYVPRMVFDYMQMVADLAAKQMPVHAYTKETAFAKTFGLTGMKINMSLVPTVVEGGIAAGLDADGNYAWEEGETFDYDTAIEIQNADGYRENCGTIAVGVSDEHIDKMLDDDNIRMVIPYHKSGLNKAVAIANNIDAFKDYTKQQNTRYADGTKLSSADSKNAPNFNEDTRRLGDPRKAADAYLAWCKENDYKPKFDKWASHPNYYKLLEDFTTLVDGEYFEQRGVTMTFPKEGDAFGSLSNLIAESLEEDAVLEGKRDSLVGAMVDEIESTLYPSRKKEPYSLSREEATAVIEDTNALNKLPEANKEVVGAMDVESYSISRNNEATIDKWFDKRGDFNEETKIAFKTYIADFKPATQLATAKWYVNGVIRLPEDMPKVEQAMTLAQKAKVDALQYNSPMEIINQYGEVFKPKEKPINPDDVPTLFHKVEVPNTDITIYDVEDSEESRVNFRNLMNSHFGKDANPWCLMEAEDGVLTESSATMWKHYNKAGYRAAFNNGKLVAFSANDNNAILWWDRMDVAHRDIPIIGKIKGDALGRSAVTLIKEYDGETRKFDKIFKGAEYVEGKYEEWFDLDTKKKEVDYNDEGKELARVEWTRKGEKTFAQYYKDNIRITEGYYNGKINSEIAVKDDGKEIVSRDWGLGDDLNEIEWQIGIDRQKYEYDNGRATHILADYAQIKFDEDGSINYYSNRAKKVRTFRFDKSGNEEVDFLSGVQYRKEYLPRFNSYRTSVGGVMIGAFYVNIDLHSEVGTGKEGIEITRNGEKIALIVNGEIMFANAPTEFIEEAMRQFNDYLDAVDVMRLEAIDIANDYRKQAEEGYAKFADRDTDIRELFLPEGATESFSIDRNQGEGAQESFSLKLDRPHTIFGGNSGYVGYSKSKRAVAAEEEGRFPKTAFKKNYGIKEDALSVLTMLGIIENEEWHHTSVYGNKTPYYGWADEDNLEIFEKNKEQILSLVKEFESKDWEYRGDIYTSLRSFEDYAKAQSTRITIWEMDDYLTPEQIQSFRDEQRAISEGGNAIGTPQERAIMHREIDSKYVDIARDQYIEQNKESLQDKYQEEVKEVEESNRRKESNDATDGKEKVAMEILELFGYDKNVAERKVLNVSIKIRKENAIAKAKTERDARVAEAQKKIDAYAKRLRKEGRLTDFVREKEAPANSIVEKREMEGKYGWFEATARYNLPVYYSGVAFDSPRTLKTYQKYVDEKRDTQYAPLGEISYSLSFEDTDTIFATAKEEFASTNDWKKTGWLMPDGTQLDFAEGGDYRGTDHRAIGAAYKGVAEHQWQYLQDFESRGGIRIHMNRDGKYGTIEMTIKPTAEQKKRLRSFIGAVGGNVDVDFMDENYNTAHSVSYDSVSPARVLSGITNFYDEGIKPKGNVSYSVERERADIERVAKENGTWLKAPNGKDTNLSPEQWVTVRTKAFKEWFGDWENDPENASKIVDENGEPRVMYHGSSWRPLRETDGKAEFKIQDGALGKGAYFSSSFQEAADYARDAMDNWDMSEDEIDEGGYVTEVFLNVRDDKQILRDNAYGGDSFIVVAISPNQIKSATENIGTFDSANDDIRYSLNRDEITVATPEMVAEANPSSDDENTPSAKAIREEIEKRIDSIATKKNVTFKEIHDLLINEDENTVAIRRLVRQWYKFRNEQGKDAEVERAFAISELKEKFNLTLEEAKHKLKEAGVAFVALQESTQARYNKIINTILDVLKASPSTTLMGADVAVWVKRAMTDAYLDMADTNIRVAQRDIATILRKVYEAKNKSGEKVGKTTDYITASILDKVKDVVEKFYQRVNKDGEVVTDINNVSLLWKGVNQPRLEDVTTKKGNDTETELGVFSTWSEELETMLDNREKAEAEGASKEALEEMDKQIAIQRGAIALLGAFSNVYNLAHDIKNTEEQIAECRKERNELLKEAWENKSYKAKALVAESKKDNADTAKILEELRKLGYADAFEAEMALAEENDKLDAKTAELSAFKRQLASEKLALLQAMREFATAYYGAEKDGRIAFKENKAMKMEQTLLWRRGILRSVRNPLFRNTIDYDEKTKELKDERGVRYGWAKRLLLRNRGDAFLKEATSTFEYEARKMDVMSIPNAWLHTGYYYQMMLHPTEGVMARADWRYHTERQMRSLLDVKVKETTGYKTIDDLKDTLNQEIGIKYNVVRMKNGEPAGDTSVHRFKVDEALYIRAVIRQEGIIGGYFTAGLEKEQIDEIVARVEERFPELCALCDWIQGAEGIYERLYAMNNVVYRKKNDRDLDHTPNYCPVRRVQDTTPTESNIGDTISASRLANGIGSNKKRIRNNIAMNLNAGFFSVLDEHISEVIQWVAFADLFSKMNSLLGNPTFKKMMKVQGISKTNLENCFLRAAGERLGEGETGGLARTINTLAKNAVASNVVSNLNTALKQMASSVAILGRDLNPALWAHFVKNFPIITNISTAIEKGVRYTKRQDIYKEMDVVRSNYTWALQNLPTFAERVDTGTMGMDIFKQDGLEENIRTWNKVSQWIKSKGMAANRFMDIIVCASVGKTIYEFEYKKNRKRGLSHEQAHDDARFTAAVFINQTQQSDQGAFVSALQSDRKGVVGTALTVGFTAYNNAQFAFDRNARSALINLLSLTADGGSAKRVAMLAEEYVGRGMSEKEAEKFAKRDYRVAISTQLMQYLANTLINPIVWAMQPSTIAFITNVMAAVLRPDEDDESIDIIQERVLKEVMEKMVKRGWVYLLPTSNVVGLKGFADAYYDTGFKSAKDLMDVFESKGGVAVQPLKKFLVDTKKYIDESAGVNDNVFGHTEVESKMGALGYTLAVIDFATRYGLGVSSKTMTRMCAGAYNALRKGNIEDFMNATTQSATLTRAYASSVRKDEKKDMNKYIERVAGANKIINGYMKGVDMREFERQYVDRMDELMFADTDFDIYKVKEDRKAMKKRLQMIPVDKNGEPKDDFATPTPDNAWKGILLRLQNGFINEYEKHLKDYKNWDEDGADSRKRHYYRLNQAVQEFDRLWNAQGKDVDVEALDMVLNHIIFAGKENGESNSEINLTIRVEKESWNENKKNFFDEYKELLNGNL